MRKLTLVSGIAAAAIQLPSAGLAQTVPDVPNVVTSHVPGSHTTTTDVHHATNVRAAVPNGQLAPADSSHDTEPNHTIGHGVDAHQVPPPPPPPVHLPHG